MPQFTIVLPVRNGGDYLKECVASILGQTYSSFNLMILDNHSSDGTLEFISALDDPRIIIYKSDKALTIEESWGRIKHFPKNEFMTMIGHDDVMEPFYLEEMNALIQSHPSASLFQTHFTYIDGLGSFNRSCLPMDEVQTAHEFLACQMNNTIESTGTGYMMRSRDFDSVGGMPQNYPNLLFADYQLWINLSRLSYKATSLRACFRYREHDSVSRLTNGMLYLRAFEIYVDFLSYLEKDLKFNYVIERYSKVMLMHYCQSLSHRLLKTPGKFRTINVSQLISLFRGYASVLIPDQPFEPLNMPKTRLALQLDNFPLGRALFQFYKRISD